MDIRLYGATVSYPSAAARLMLEHKRLPYTWVRLIPGTHALLPLAGFPGATVPALKVDGRRVTGSAQIARVLDELRPEPALLPADPGRRRAVEEAEAWGDAVLQPIPRRLLRWAIRHDADARVTVARILGTSRPELVGRLVIPPVAVLLARREDAGSTDRIAADWAALPAHLDHAEQLIADGVLGADRPTAADFQIGATLRAMLDFEDYAPLVRGRRLEALARRVMPDYPFRWPPLMPLVSARSARARGTRGCASSRTRSARSTARPAARA